TRGLYGTPDTPRSGALPLPRPRLLRLPALHGQQLLVRDGAAEPAVAGGELHTRPPQVAPVEVRPQHVLEHQLGISALPQQVVGGALLTAGPPEEIHIRPVRVVQ